MTNREKYAEQIIDMAAKDIKITVDKEGRLSDCFAINCHDCAWRNCGNCRKKFREWLEQEYVEPVVDWSKVPVDTKVFVRDCDSAYWNHRYFAKFEDGKIFTWANGTTSFTAKGFDDVTWWNQGKLAEDTV
jgi:hypothetical protein